MRGAFWRRGLPTSKRAVFETAVEDNGLRMHFAGWARPLETCAMALESVTLEPSSAFPMTEDAPLFGLTCRSTTARACRLSNYRGKTLLPIKNSSMARAACRPSRIAHTTSDWPRRTSPAANSLSTLVR